MNRNSKTMWVTSRFDVVIDRVTVDHATDCFVWIRGRRHGRTTDWKQYHESYAAARAFLVARCSAARDRAESVLKVVSAELEKANALPVEEP